MPDTTGVKFNIGERNIERGPFFGGDRIHVVDLKLYMAVRWLNGGKVDHIPATIFADTLFADASMTSEPTAPDLRNPKLPPMVTNPANNASAMFMGDAPRCSNSAGWPTRPTGALTTTASSS